MEKYITAMKQNEVGFLSHQIVLDEHTLVNPNSEALLKFATTTDNETFIHLTVVYENGLVTFTDSETNVLWSNKRPIFASDGDKTLVTFEIQ